jgi:valyl-tRNA synthetase
MKLNKLKELASKILKKGKQKLKIDVKSYADNKEFVDKAPEEIVKKEKEKITSYQEQLDSLKSKLDNLK